MHLPLKISGHNEVSKIHVFCNFINKVTGKIKRNVATASEDQGHGSCILEFKKVPNNMYKNLRIDTYFQHEASRSYGSKLQQKKQFFGLASLQGTKKTLFIELNNNQ